MRRESERRLLQVAVAVGCLVPLTAGAEGVLEGPATLKSAAGATNPDLDSQFRYLSGLLLGVGLCFAAAIPTIERRSELVTALAATVVVGGAARLVALASGHIPSAPHLLALGMELGIVPLLWLWQRRIAHRFKR